MTALAASSHHACRSCEEYIERWLSLVLVVDCQRTHQQSSSHFDLDISTSLLLHSHKFKWSAALPVQDLQGALEAYSAVLAFPEATAADKLAAASNRAACNLAKHNYSSTVSDCSMAFSLLTGQDLHASLDLHAWLASEQGVLRAWLLHTCTHGPPSCTRVVLSRATTSRSPIYNAVRLLVSPV